MYLAISLSSSLTLDSGPSQLLLGPLPAQEWLLQPVRKMGAHRAGMELELGSYLCICSAAFSACYRMCASVTHHSIGAVEM